MHQSEVNNSVRREQSKVTDDPHRVVSKQQGRFVAFSLGVRLVVISGLAGAIEPRSFRAVRRAWKARCSTVVRAFAFSKPEQRFAGEGARATGATAFDSALLPPQGQADKSVRPTRATADSLRRCSGQALGTEVPRNDTLKRR